MIEVGQLFETFTQLGKRFGVHGRTIKRDRQRHKDFPPALVVGKKGTERFDVALAIQFYQRKGQAAS